MNLTIFLLSAEGDWKQGIDQFLVGCVIAVGALAIMLWLVFWKRHRKK